MAPTPKLASVTAAWLRERYDEQHRSLRQIAAELGCSVGTVGNKMREFDIPRRSARQTLTLQGRKVGKLTVIFPQLHDRAWLEDQYIREHRSQQEIADVIGCTGSAVCNAFRKLGIEGRAPQETRRVRGTKHRSTKYPLLNDAAWLTSQYETSSFEEIARLVGCTIGSVQKAMKRHGIASRGFGKRPNPNLSWFDGTHGYRMRYDVKRHRPVYDHRVLVEQALGRPLKPGETVHHLNLNRADNRLDNLIVLPSNAAHRHFHLNPPSWVPRCACCGHPLHEQIERRPDDVPLVYEP